MNDEIVLSPHPIAGLENDPRFLEKIRIAREDLQAGRGQRLEEIDWKE